MPFSKFRSTRKRPRRLTENQYARSVRRSRAWNSPSTRTFLTSFNPFPAVHTARLTYVQKVTLQSTGNGQAPRWFFRANSIYDPDATGISGGGQPYGRDTYAGIYNHYKVLSSVITVAGNSNQQSPETNGIGIVMDDDASVATAKSSAKELCARKGSTYTTFASRNQNGSVQISRKFDTRFFVNQNHQCAPMGANPTDGYYFGIFSMDDQIASTMNCTVTITYLVRMWELKDLSAQ